MVKDLIRYDLLVQDALKGVVRKVLTDASRQGQGLPGDHHFYITFLTTHPGVRISNRLREKYPHEMTIVVQHQFWDLHVGETAFEIGLSFSNIPERLHVSFDAMTGFFDPSVQFGLKFNVPDDGAAPAPEPVPLDTELARKTRETKERAATHPEQETIHSAEEAASDKKKKDTEKREAKPAQPKTDKGESAEVVSLDSFRKK